MPRISIENACITEPSCYDKVKEWINETFLCIDDNIDKFYIQLKDIKSFGIISFPRNGCYLEINGMQHKIDEKQLLDFQSLQKLWVIKSIDSKLLEAFKPAELYATFVQAGVVPQIYSKDTFSNSWICKSIISILQDRVVQTVIAYDDLIESIEEQYSKESFKHGK